MLDKKNKVLLIIAGLLFLAAVPLTIIQVQTQQTTEQQASVDPVYLKLAPQTNTVNANDNFIVSLHLYGVGTRNIAGATVTINYNSSLLRSGSASTAPNLQLIPDPNDTLGTIRFNVVYLGVEPLNGADITLGSLTFKALTPGTGNLSLSNIQVVDYTSQQTLPIDANNTQGASFTIASGGVIPTNTPTPTPSPTVPPAAGDIMVKFADNAVFGSIFTDKDGDVISHKDQDLTIYLYSSTDNPSEDLLGEHAVAKATGKLAFQNGRFIAPVGGINIGQVAPGTYKVLIKSPKYLRQLVDTQTLTQGGGTITLTLNKSLADGAGDVDDNNVLNIQDYNAIAVNCFGDKMNNSQTCKFKEGADLNDDGVIDGVDYNIFLKSLSFTQRQGD